MEWCHDRVRETSQNADVANGLTSVAGVTPAGGSAGKFLQAPAHVRSSVIRHAWFVSLLTVTCCWALRRLAPGSCCLSHASAHPSSEERARRLQHPTSWHPTRVRESMVSSVDIVLGTSSEIRHKVRAPVCEFLWPCPSCCGLLEQIMRSMGLRFRVSKPDIDEKRVQHADPRRLPVAVATAKAEVRAVTTQCLDARPCSRSGFSWSRPCCRLCHPRASSLLPRTKWC